MSGVPTELEFGERPEPGPSGRRLSISATAYLVAISGLAIFAAMPFVPRLQTEQHSVTVWLTFVIFAVGAAVAQVALVKTPRNQSYHATNVFLIPAILLLPPELVVVIAVVQHIPAWLKNRTAWYRECFNICNYVIATLAAWGTVRLVLQADGLIPNSDLRFALAGAACSLVLVGLNHAMLAPMLLLGHGHSIRESGLFSFHGLTTELVLAALGVVVATFWHANPWLIPFAVAPVLLIHRSLSVPQLEAEARVDPKTGLFNARHFGLALNEEIVRAQRFERPLSLIMADLDLLRDINNTYGHLAGDAVLKGIAEVFRTQLRHYDVPARFGGEEFSILLPETSAGRGVRDRRAHQARGRRARLRRRDVEPADPGDGLDRRRCVPARRPGRERAHPPGRPRRLPGQAPGPEPRPRRDLRAAGRPGRPEAAARRRARDRRPPSASAAGRRADPARGAAPSADRTPSTGRGSSRFRAGSRSSWASSPSSVSRRGCSGSSSDRATTSLP